MRKFSLLSAVALLLVAAGTPAWATLNVSIDTNAAYTNFERLSPATAQRVTRFWQIRQGSDAA